jgi:hypothetical protein
MDPSTGEHQISHYEPRTNRCYVRLDRIALNSATADYARLLFDGQTDEVLALAEVKEGTKIGKLSGKDVGWDSANQFIDAVMAGGRTQ